MASIITNTTTSPTTVTYIDEASASLTYIGTAKLGATTSSAVWQIRRIQKSSTVTAIQYADGDRRFNNIWDDRTSLSYTN